MFKHGLLNWRNASWFGLGVVIVLGLLLITSKLATAEKELTPYFQSRNDKKGIQAGDLRPENRSRDQLVDKMVASGAAWVRLDLQENSQGIDAAYRPLIQKLKGQGIKVIGLLSYDIWPAADRNLRNVNAVENGGSNGDNAYVQAFAAKSGQIAKQLRDLVDYWEIWNEPNAYTPKGTCYDNGTQSTNPQQSNLCPSVFAQLLVQTSKKIKEDVPSGSPPIIVVSGGVNGDPQQIRDYLSLTYQYALKYPLEGAPLNIDGIGLHIYTSNNSYNRFINAALGAGISKPVYITEIGWPVSPYQDNGRDIGVTEQEQANILSSAYTTFSGRSEVAAAIWFTLQDQPNFGFGLLRDDWTPKPSWCAFTNRPTSDCSKKVSLSSPSPGKTLPSDVDVALAWQPWANGENVTYNIYLSDKVGDFSTAAAPASAAPLGIQSIIPGLQPIGTTTGITYPLTGTNLSLTAGHSYYWKVVATNAAGETAESDVWSFTITDTPCNFGDDLTITRPPNSQGRPSLAYGPDAQEYFVAFAQPNTVTQKIDIYGQYLDRNGQRQGAPLPLVTNLLNDDQIEIDVKYGGGSFFVVWGATGTSGRVLHGKWIYEDGNGQPILSEPISITEESQPVEGFSAAYNPVRQQFLVAWSSKVAPTVGTYARYVSRAPAYLGPRALIEAGTYGGELKVVYNSQANNYLFAYNIWLGTAYQQEIYAQLVNADLVSSPKHQLTPNVPRIQWGISAAYDPAANEYLVTWADERTTVGITDIYGQRLTANNISIGGNQAIVAGDGVSHWLTDLAPLQSGTGSYLMLWEDNIAGQPKRTRGLFLTITGTATSEAFQITSQPGIVQGAHIALDGSGRGLVAWDNYETGMGHVYGRLFSPAMCQPTQQNTVYGQVIAEDPNVSVDGALVHACAESGPCQVTAVNNSGSYTFGNLGDGTYTFKAFPPANTSLLPSAEVLISVSGGITLSVPPLLLLTSTYVPSTTQVLGQVINTDGTPVTGATVTLYRADNAEGTFSLVPNGSSILSPLNRRNPDVTNSSGYFGWEVLAGFYKIRAAKAGCFAPGDNAEYVESVALLVPPALTHLELRLNCSTATGTPTPVPTNTWTPTPTPTNAWTPTPTPTKTSTPIATTTWTPTPTPTPPLTIGCRVSKGAVQALGNGQVTALTFDTQINDSTPGDNCWTPAEPSRLYARESGYYLAGGAVTLTSNASRSGRISLIIRRGGSSWVQAQTAHAHAVDDSTYSVMGGMFHLNVGEYIEIVVYHMLGDGIQTYQSSACEHCINGWLMKIGD